jgi:signal transduction histidine kinase
VMEIVDNGVGLNGDHPPAHGQGLRNMHARAVSIGARLEMTGQPGQGTQVQLTLPVQ